jgi:hypothetical protein
VNGKSDRGRSGPCIGAKADKAVTLAKVDVQKLTAGYRASKIVGSSVTNDTQGNIGKVDDLLVSPDGKNPFVVLSIGGFLGMGTHLVAIPFDSLKLVENKVVLPGGTKDGLRMLPEFKCTTDWTGETEAEPIPLAPEPWMWSLSHIVIGPICRMRAR